jgi:predicted nucleic acid-binding protein
VWSALFDTSIYVAALRSGSEGVLTVRRLDSGSVVWLSSVVLEELYAGASGDARRVVERLERDFNAAKRILVPNLGDWTDAGRVLSRLAVKYDFEQIGQGRMTNDALIATSAGRLGASVITTNARDFQRLAEFHPFQWLVMTV